ncbi:MAG: hypothetical protein ACYDCN_06395 [Bacteroidia bacterium]
MAIARCLEHAPGNRGRNYTHYVEPVSHPHSGLICGKNNCNEPAFIFLDAQDMTTWNGGGRIFGIPGSEQAKFKANSIIKPNTKYKPKPNNNNKPKTKNK